MSNGMRVELFGTPKAVVKFNHGLVGKMDQGEYYFSRVWYLPIGRNWMNKLRGYLGGWRKYLQNKKF